MVEQDDAHKEHGYWQKPENWVAFLTLLAVLTYTGIQMWQTWLMHENNIVSQRAFIYIEAPKIHVSIDQRDNGTEQVVFTSLLANSGNTPTKDLHTYIRCAPAIEALPEPWVLLYREKLEGVPEVIGPHQTVFADCALKVSQLIDIQSGRLHGYLMGEILYHDGIDKTAIHRTQFSWEMVDVNVVPALLRPPYMQVGPSSVNSIFIKYKPIGKHNCADDDCPQ